MHNRANQMLILHILKISGSFTKAAERLEVSTSHVSKQLTQLESELNVQLVQRTTRSLTLTDAGIEFSEYCAQLYSAMQNAEAAMMDATTQMSGTIRLALSRSFGTLHVLPVLDKLQENYPEINFEITLTDRKIDMLEEDIHLWITTYENINEGYIAQRVADGHFVLAASPKYIEKHGAPVHPQDLSNHNCVTYHSSFRDYSDWPFLKNNEQLNISVSGNYRVDLSEAVRDAVIASHGVGYIATYLLSDELKTGQLVQLLPDWKTNLEMPVYAVYPRKKHLPERLNAIISFLKENIGYPAYWDVALTPFVKHA
ncbi:LysR family transcriptional regulator [Psychromonas sp. Urea-02u-13]|uniref:LysR family transcriptional regulator n=1 Tax=Psychromonas sp. Urea-02u-13 TaxID=2058326 RepID=UPI000C340958|nr:LysR family transcriptional regulator [Psychromonas sp. Urea-02u-13]PKG38052.1 LysR family transcriptional regulator [Psychromonas sp. Urea-02u-13]